MKIRFNSGCAIGFGEVSFEDCTEAGPRVEVTGNVELRLINSLSEDKTGYLAAVDDGSVNVRWTKTHPEIAFDDNVGRMGPLRLRLLSLVTFSNRRRYRRS